MGSLLELCRLPIFIGLVLSDSLALFASILELFVKAKSPAITLNRQEEKWCS